jgi:DNA-binding CsgD family transcriptional regulator
MAKSDLLRFEEVRSAYRLIGECRDLGSDPALWQPRLCEGLCQLIGAPAASAGEGLWLRPHRALEPLGVFQAGFDARAYEILIAYVRNQGPGADPLFRALGRVPGRLVTLTRRQLVTDAVWYQSAAFTDYRRVAGTDHQLASVYQTSGSGTVSAIGIHRPLGDRDYSPREVRLLHFFHGELGPLIGRSLVSAAEPSPEKLSPRLRQTLACLLQGDSEKQVAHRLGLSHPTIHQYVTALYRHFGVRSRAQLLAHVMKRTRRGPWEQFTPATGERWSSPEAPP